jgi:hypothetical protein
VPFVYDYGKALDELGLVKDNYYMAVYIPPTNKAFVFWVKGRVNSGYEILHYGPLPLVSGLQCTGYTGNNLTVPATGVLPPANYCSPTPPLPPPPQLMPVPTNTNQANFMFYFDKSDKLFQLRMFIKPRWVRAELQVPPGVEQVQINGYYEGVSKPGGWARGYLDFIVFPGLTYGFVFGNDMVFGVLTGLDIIYGEYNVNLVTDLDVVYNVLTHQLPSAWFVFPVTHVDTTVNNEWVKYYGFTGFTVPQPGVPRSQWEAIARGELPRR